MLQIRLNKGSSADGGGGGGGSVKPSPPETVTVACPDHLVLADLPVAKGIGAATAASLVKTVGRRSRRQLGERVHFCVRCDFPIAIYGRLSPCEHAFCLDCARSDSICYLCDERIQKIQTIKMMEGIFICAAPHCLKSFLKKPEFESHIHETHTNLLQPNADRDDGKESDMQSGKQSTGSDSTLRGPPRPVFSPGSNPQFHDNEEKARRQQPREQLPPRPMMQPKAPQMFGQLQNYPSDPQQDTSHPPGFDRPGPHNHYHQGFDRQGTPQPESSHYSDKQHGLLSENQFSEYPPVHSMQPPNFAMPMNPNPVLTPYGVPQFPTDGTPPFYAAPYEMARPNSAPDASEQGSLLGFPPGAVGGINYPSNYPQPWNTGQPGMPFEAPPAGPGMVEAFPNYQGDYGRNPGGLPLMPPAVPPANKGMEPMQANNSMDSRDGKGIVAPLPMQVPPPPPSIPPHMSQHQRGKYHSGDMGRDGQGFGWQHENRDSFGSSQE